MIQNWDIVSSLNTTGSGDLLYALVMDGTEQDARLIAKKLHHYIQGDAQPALAPYIYHFPLSADLDEDTQEKIRDLMREGVKQAEQFNQLVPGGNIGNDTFSSPNKTNTGFPTFLTMDPSESSQYHDNNTTAPRGPKVIDLSNPQEDALPILQTLPSAANSSKVDLNHSQEWVSAQTLNEFFHTSPSQLDSKPPISSQQLTNSEEHKEDSTPALSTMAKESNSPKAEDTTSTSPKQLEDIFLAETKYDIFVDIAKEAPQTKAAAALAKPSNNSDKTIKPDSSASGLPPVTPDAPEQAAFNIFDQKMKDQTSVVDIDDVADITQRLAEKDLSFIEHAQPSADASTDASHVPQSPAQDEEPEEVMDPFEQLLSGTTSFQTDTPSEQSAPTQQSASVPPAPETTSQVPVAPIPAPTQSNSKTETKADTETENRVFPAAKMENTMNENEGANKTFIKLKRKAQAQQIPAAPQPPQPEAPQPPQPAQPPTSELPPEPQEEKHRTILRKRRPNKTFLEKTTTIDHSIELPLSELKKHNWPLEVPLIPTYTLENMTISINRFAHATAISVIENPGRLYNPLVLHGSSGTGKTHFLHAIGYALSKKYGQENIFITNGVRLSRGIQRYIMEGNIAKFEEFTSSVKALLIDDIHLISINEQNRSHLSKLLNDFMAQNKQIVITSKYPPENLAKLEELLNFKLDSGWISDLKQAHGPARMRIIQNMLSNNGINITNEDVNRFFGHPNMSLGTVVRSIRRVRVLEKLMFQNLDNEKRSALTIFDQLLATKGEDQSSLIAQKAIDEVQSAAVLGNGEWGRIGFFYPQNHSNMMNWLLFALQQRAKELGIPGGPELAVRSSYSTENIISSAFKIANLCDNKKLKGAVILGPSINTCEPSVRENFYDILTHMLEIMLIRCGVINFEDAAAPSTYVKILSELLR